MAGLRGVESGAGGRRARPADRVPRKDGRFDDVAAPQVIHDNGRDNRTGRQWQ
jgi:hypothetical protein